MSNVSILEVYLHDRLVGTITNVQGDRSIFAFAQRYVDDEYRPTLSLGFKSDLGELITNIKPIRTKVHPFFSNLLPEGPMRTYLAKLASVNEAREFPLLAALGQDLPGAIKIFPAEGEGSHQSIEEENQFIPSANQSKVLRFSLAGVQLKFSALKNEGKNGGLTIPAKGIGGEWIVKLPSQKFSGVPENEFSMMTIAKHIGINVPKIGMINLSEIDGLPDGIGELSGRAFAIERFDRTLTGPVHIEDFAQIFNTYPDDKYKRATYRRILNVLAEETDEYSIREFIRRLIFSTLIGNDDMHLKNWSLIYPDQRNAILSPAYDLLSTIAYLPSDEMALKYSRTNKMSELTFGELAYMAAKAMVPEYLVIDTARETIENFMNVWRTEKYNLLLDGKVITAVDNHLDTLKILR